MTFTVKDATIISANIQGITWKANAKILVSGSLNELITGTMDGKISSVTPKGSAAQGQIVFTITASESNGNSSELLAAVASGSSGTQYSSSQIKHFTVMVYNVDNFDVGIELNCYGDNSSMYLQMMSGTSATPVVRLGNLTGANLPSVITNGVRNSPEGYGLFATNAYLAGAIISTEGQIGGFTIGDTTLSNGTFASSGGVFVSTGKTATSSQKIGGSDGSLTWAFTAGSTFGVTTAGTIYATSGKIAGWTLGTNVLSTGTYGSDSSVFISNTNMASKAIAGTTLSTWRLTVGSHFGVTNTGAVYANSGKIGCWNIGSTSFYSDGHAAYDTNANGIYMDATYLAGGKQAAWYFKNDGSAKIGAMTLSSAGVLSVPAANITGTLSVGVNNVTGLNDLLDEKASASDFSALSNKVNAIQGTCSASYQSTRDKVVDCSGFDFYDGALIAVTFSSSNTYYSNSNNTASLRLNVNGTGLRDVWVDSAVTSNTNQLLWAQGAIITFRYSGNANSGKYIVVGEPRSWYGASDIVASTATKTDNVTPITGCVVCKGTRVSLSMKYENTADAPKLNISGTGEINLYSGNDQSYRPKASNGRSWTNESTASFVFDGRYWRIAETSGLSKAYIANTNAVSALTNANTAATKATSYITDITSDGVFVHEKSSSDVTPTTSGVNGVHISSDVKIIRNAQVVATYGTTITLGQTSSYNTQISSSGLNFYNNGTALASYGSTITIGKTGTNDRNVYIDSNGVNIRKASTVLATYGDTITLGQIADGQTRVQIDDNSLDIISRTSGTDTPVATFGEVSRIGIGASTTFDSASLSFSNENSEEIMRLAGDGIVIGKSSNPTFTVDSRSIALLDADGEDVFRVTYGGGGTYTQKTRKKFTSKFSSSQISSGSYNVNAIDNVSQIASYPRNVKVEFYYFYTLEYIVNGQTLTREGYSLRETKNLILTTHYTRSYTDNPPNGSGKITLNADGMNQINTWIQNYCYNTTSRVLFYIEFEYDCHIPTYSNLNMNGNIVVAGTGGGNIACVDLNASGYVRADVVDVDSIIYTDTLNAPLFIYRDFSTSSLTVGANAAFAISFSQLNNYSVPTGYVPFAFSRISVDNNYLYFRWMNPDSIFNGSVAVGRNSSSSQQTFVLSVRIIFAQGGLFGT